VTFCVTVICHVYMYSMTLCVTVLYVICHVSMYNVTFCVTVL